MRQRHEKLERAGRLTREITAWCKDFTLLAAGCCMIALTIKAWPVIGSVNRATQQATQTLSALQQTSDRLATLEQQATDSLAASDAVMADLRLQISKVGNVAGHLAIFTDDANLRVNDELIPRISQSARELQGTAAAATETLNEGRDALAAFKLAYAANPRIESLLKNYDQASQHLNALADHGERVAEDMQVAADYGREKIEALKKPKAWYKISAVAVVGFSLRVAIETLAHVISGH